MGDEKWNRSCQEVTGKKHSRELFFVSRASRRKGLWRASELAEKGKYTIERGEESGGA